MHGAAPSCTTYPFWSADAPWRATDGGVLPAFATEIAFSGHEMFLAWSESPGGQPSSTSSHSTRPRPGGIEFSGGDGDRDGATRRHGYAWREPASFKALGVRAILSRGRRRLLGGAGSWLPRRVVVEKAQEVSGEHARPARATEHEVAILAVRRIDDHLNALARRSQPLLEIAPDVDLEASVVLRPQDEHRCRHGPSRLLP